MLRSLLSSRTTTIVGRSHALLNATVRGLATRRKVNYPVPQEILDALPVYDDSPITDAALDPDAYVRSPVTSAHMIDLVKQEVSALDSAAIDPKGGGGGQIIHGRYGVLSSGADAVPLEYLALLRPAAEGAAAWRVLTDGGKKQGTMLVYGATQASGMAVSQMAAAATSACAVVAVVDNQHSGNEDMVENLKGLLAEPSTAVPEEFALSKQNFKELVASIASGDEGIPRLEVAEALQDFKQNFVDYSAMYPDTRPAAVSEEHMNFKFMEKDRENWELNMSTYLDQFPKGAPPVDKAKLDALFTSEQYEIFRRKFGIQTTAVISGDDPPFSAPHIVHEQIQAPETLDNTTYPGAGPTIPYHMNILETGKYPAGTEIAAGGPVLGAVIVVTPPLAKAAALVSKAQTTRAKAEALQFLSATERAAYLSATSVVAQAANGKVVTIGGSLPGLDQVEPTEADVQEALSAMDIDDEGNSRLNYFCQVYRANDFPFYSDYAVHRATEPLAGPRQIIVTK